MAQSAAVSINDEPHHKRLLYTNNLRLWEVTLRPGEATQPFVHEYDVATVVIGDGTLSLERNGEAVTPPSPNARGSVVVAEHTGRRTMYRINAETLRTIHDWSGMFARYWRGQLRRIKAHAEEER